MYERESMSEAKHENVTAALLSFSVLPSLFCPQPVQGALCPALSVPECVLPLSQKSPRPGVLMASCCMHSALP